ncbi:M48 family metallopeptidase [Pseudocnuella soli]|uniref:M48 family metallopeptidase n=1 Tax=Pseudocnuella soli TaxID=2502779 RepID=UPI00104DC8D5|nr:M48 family metallopeptidase [Pseudocnuella soli]
MEQIATTALFYDGYSARPAPVRVVLADGRLHLHDPYDDVFIQSFPLAGISHNGVGRYHFFYLDPKGLIYLKFEEDHPLVPQLLRELSASQRGWASRLMRQKLVLLIPIMLALSVGLYFLLVGLVPFIGLRLISRDSEITLGNKLHAVMMEELSFVGNTPDTAGTYRLQAFAKNLQLSKEYPIRLTLVHSDIVNAYALPGGQVVVYTGLLRKLKTPEALAALLAHESTHVNSRHSMRSLLRSSANGLLVSIVFGDATGISGALAGNLENLSGLRYSRSLETEADELGMDLMRRNGVAPQGMVQLMKTLQTVGDMPSELSFLSSHPLTKTRIKRAEQYCKKWGNVPANTRLQQSFDALQEAVAEVED